MSLIEAQDQARISEAIAAAESRTTGEIVVVIAMESASWMSIPIMIAALVALLVPWPLIFFTWITVQAIYAAQLVVFVLLVALLVPRPIRFRIVPRTMLHTRAHRRALEQFVTLSLPSTHDRAGVLLFASVAERHVEIVADIGLNDKVAPEAWKAIVDRLTKSIRDGRPADGLVDAIGAIGERLHVAFPGGPDDAKRLPDQLIVLD